MQTLFAACFEGPQRPSFDVRCLKPGRKLPDGWGIGFYPKGEPCATVLKEAAPSVGAPRTDFVEAWDQLESSVFVVQLRTAHWGTLSVANTQPFARSHGRRDYLFAHAGSLNRKPDIAVKARFQAVGSTDSEALFCLLLERIAEAGASALGDLDPHVLQGWMEELRELGDLTAVLGDGNDLLVYAGYGDETLHLGRVFPPFERCAFGDADLGVDLCRRGPSARKGAIVSSLPLAAEQGEGPRFELLEPGRLVILRQGDVIADLPPPKAAPERVSRVPSRWLQPRPTQAPVRTFDVRHLTTYRYAEAVQRSTHLFRLEPMHDRLQRLESFELKISVNGKLREYEDVFGNRARRLEVTHPFEELSIEARSRVVVLDSDPFKRRPPHQRSGIPLVWMPWQREVLAPYLLPPELPETQLRELTDYAMSFVERSDFDVLDMLFDLNTTIFREYRYAQGETSVRTTAFDVYEQRRGVCQDFSNLFICLARLLGIPARYMCGYVYTGPKPEGRNLSDASHAWVQVYLPELGWRGLDPTNGSVTQTEHVRVAAGRNYIDATPTSGTLFEGGGAETLSVSVSVEPIES
ncbi:MAG TPA: class II glutamine amidotransferase [Polyangiaceae bacterium]|nr:class II glutamine amidotransferase [Polyangiaceae bacterium]